MTDKTKRLLIHIPHGLAFGAGVLYNAPLGLGWLFLCIWYQIHEDWRIADNSWKDLRGYMTGVPIGVILYWIIKWVMT